MTITHAKGTISAVPVNGQPTTLAEFIDDEARAYRAQGTPEAAFIADHLERVAQLVRWTGASTPEEHEDRMSVWDAEIAARQYDRSYSDGYSAARHELASFRS